MAEERVESKTRALDASSDRFHRGADWFQSTFHDCLDRDAGDYGRRVLQWLVWVRRTEARVWGNLDRYWGRNDAREVLEILAFWRGMLVFHLAATESFPYRWSFILG